MTLYNRAAGIVLEKLERLKEDQLTIFKYDWSSKVVMAYQEGLVIGLEEILYIMNIREKDLVVTTPEDLAKVKELLDQLSSQEFSSYLTLRVSDWGFGLYDNADALENRGPNLVEEVTLNSLDSKFAMWMFKLANPLYKKNRAILNK